MPLDPEKLLGLPPVETRQHLTPKDVMLYALGIGADELAFTYEENLLALPTMASVIASPGFVWRDPSYGVDWKRLLHGETSLEIHAPLPVEGELLGRTAITSLYDKGAEKGAIAYQTRTITDATGRMLATVRNASFLRGDGGFGGNSNGQPVPNPVPERTADLVRRLPTAINQAMLYRLSGDFNPIHADPEAARAGGFPRPILHGLCSFGIAGRAVLGMLCGNAPHRLRRIDVRFSSPVFPGETIETQIWHVGNGTAAFRATVPERNVVVLNNGYVEFTVEP